MSRTPTESIRELLAIQCANGNWNYDPYMHGMANGMILCMALLDGVDPQYLSAPAQWLRDLPSTAPETAPQSPQATTPTSEPGV